uniref:Apple domain-containing protein n=1 Tax=Globisporangium ultimum (strain ATCC 200006 / CBS 805.95 / DAOM BR144) TaxID=431595 RepID=K3XBK6_GLOUD
MTPIAVESLYERDQSSTRDSSDLVAGTTTKQCFFQHFARSWMDSNGDANDLMNAQVKTVDECEKLCCEHPECRSFTMWMGTTCFLRALPGTPRADGNSFSGNRLT